ncbi:MAG: hypothetical protein HY231_14925 [Acidobacteria bacterium]|nr:hypothetical protein [Acidobacteriota bacterium]
MPLKVVAERLGHSSAKITSDVYWHTAPDAQKLASESFEEIVFTERSAGKTRTNTEIDGQNMAKKRRATR